MSGWLAEQLGELTEPDATARAALADRAANILRPTGALARLDEIAVFLGGWQHTSRPRVVAPVVAIFAADHGVAVEGVSAYPAEITGAMLAAFRAGVSSVNAMARTVGARVEAIDVGVGRPTGNLRHEQAMDADRFDAAATTGAQTVATLAESGALDLLIIGEMGIGNTTAAAAVSAALFGGDVAGWVGRGTGVTSEAHINKIAVVGDAVARVGDAQSPLEILRQLGGAELVAMAGAVVEARRRSIPVVLDGYVTAAAVAPLALTRAGSLDHCLAGHVSAEPGHRRLLDRLGLSPLLDLGMRLGEASGALAAVPLIQMACALVLDVPTFDEWLAG